MPPTMKEDDARPSAPPLNDVESSVVSIPVVQAIRGPSSAHIAVPAGMAKRTVTTTYSDGRQETVTEFQNPGASSAFAGTAPMSAPPVTVSQHHPPRLDLGARPIKVTCPYCNQTDITKTRSQVGLCTIISVIVLIFCFFPLFWIPFICPSVSDPLFVSYVLSHFYSLPHTLRISLTFDTKSVS